MVSIQRQHGQTSLWDIWQVWERDLSAASGSRPCVSTMLTQHLSLTARTHLRRIYCNCFQVWASLSGWAIHTCSFAAMLQVHKVKIQKISSNPLFFKDKPVLQRVTTLSSCALQDPSLHAASSASPVPPWLQAERCDARVPGPGSFDGCGPPPLWATPLCSGPSPGNRPAGSAGMSASARECHFWWPGRIRWRPQSKAWQEKQITINKLLTVSKLFESTVSCSLYLRFQLNWEVNVK